jgi:hypothetical protein
VAITGRSKSADLKYLGKKAEVIRAERPLYEGYGSDTALRETKNTQI